MKKLFIIALAMLMPVAANAGSTIQTTTDFCGNHTVIDTGMKTDESSSWVSNFVVKTNNTVVYIGNGSHIFTSYDNNQIGVYSFPGFIFVSNLNTMKDSYSNDGGTTYHSCSSSTHDTHIQ
ncbi:MULTISPECIES: hypothetical protein [unclassified Klebsiella]|uniref:hypothetical protein n=1 Tax=unclassified Klebsiella TaxID=2608929 RepID=UPI0010551BB8|nr:MULTISPECIES: hypothetical protein [unclassified Klebsiella]